MYNYTDIIGDTFEDMSIGEMATMQGLGDIEGRKSSTPVVASAKLNCSSQACAGFTAGIIITIIRCNN